MPSVFCIDGPHEGELLEVSNETHFQAIYQEFPPVNRVNDGLKEPTYEACHYRVHVILRTYCEFVPSLPKWKFIDWEDHDFFAASPWFPFRKFTPAILRVYWRVASISKRPLFPLGLRLPKSVRYDVSLSPARPDRVLSPNAASYFDTSKDETI